MNCDQAFDVMTSSRSQSDRALPVHLAGCRRCREMRVTLEPALGMFQADALLSQHPHPWEVSSEGTEVATRAARRLNSPTPAPRHGTTGLWGYAVAVVLGAGLVWCSFAMNPSAAMSPSIQHAKTVCLYQTDSRPTGKTGYQMTQSCLACHAVAEQK